MPRDRKRRRLATALRRLIRDDDLVDSALALVFDTGKITGQLVAQLNGAGSP